jgi:uncharacterized protein YdeI (YjbR/CyaY-like superfamily)
MSKLDALQRVEVLSRADWRAWLMKNHLQSESIWLVRYKQGDPRHVSWSDAVDEALCFGWIDSRPRKLDDQRSMLLLGPRKPKSAWSGINKEKVARLISEGLMTKVGLKKVDSAKATGTWDTLTKVEALEIPDDLAKAFAKSKIAQINFEAFPKSVKRAILDWINQAKKPETRAKRLTETVSKAEQNIRASQWRP